MAFSIITVCLVPTKQAQDFYGGYHPIIEKLGDKAIKISPSSYLVESNAGYEAINEVINFMSERAFNSTFKHFSRLIIDLHIQWQMFHDLHKDIDNYTVFNSTAPNFFMHLRSYLYDLIFLSISRLFDLPKQFGSENLCLEHMISYEEVAGIRDELVTERERRESLWKSGIKIWRHKRLSHNDLPTIFDEQHLPEVPNKDIEALVEGIVNFARLLESHVYERDQNYEVYIDGWVPQLVKYLTRGIDTGRCT